MNSLEARVEKMEDNMAKILQNQATQTAMLQQLLNTNTNVHSIDANKKGETDVEVHEPATEKITGEGDVTAALRKKKMLEISSTSSQTTSHGEQSSALIAENAQQMLISIAQTIKDHEDDKAARAKAMEDQNLQAVILKHLTPDRVFKLKKMKVECSLEN